MQLGTVLFVAPLAAAMLCGLGMWACCAIMSDEVQVRLPENDRIRFPGASWNTFKVTRLHREFYPASRVRVMYRLLARLALACLATSASVMTYSAFSNPGR
jgi:hypothetical protein